MPIFSSVAADFNGLTDRAGASRVRAIFNHARIRAPCIVFLTSLIPLDMEKGNLTAADERMEALNHILMELDSPHSVFGLLVVAAVANAGVLDSTCLLTGRFDKCVGAT